MKYSISSRKEHHYSGYFCCEANVHFGFEGGRTTLIQKQLRLNDDVLLDVYEKR